MVDASKMTPEEKIKVLEKNTVEIINKEDLNQLFSSKKPVVYCGYEPSGEIHLGHLVTMTKLIQLQELGCQIKVLMADWHGWLNQKGNWEEMDKAVKTWIKGFKAAGLDKAEYIEGSSFQRSPAYMDDLMKVAVDTTMNRALRSMQQVARDIEHAKVSQVIYPLMQICDIKHLGVDIVESGIEQRKIHMLGLEVFDKIGYKKPVLVHTPLISSLKGPGGKMSSSEPDSYISISDDEESLKNKIRKAYCPEGDAKENAILEITKLIIFPRFNKLKIERPDKFGGDVSYNSYADLEKDFKEKKLHPQDLKNAVAKSLYSIIKPIREKVSF